MILVTAPTNIQYTLPHVKLQWTHPADPISKFFSQWLCQPGMLVVLVVVSSPIFKCKVTCYKWWIRLVICWPEFCPNTTFAVDWAVDIRMVSVVALTDPPTHGSKAQHWNHLTGSTGKNLWGTGWRTCICWASRLCRYGVKLEWTEQPHTHTHTHIYMCATHTHAYIYIKDIYI